MNGCSQIRLSTWMGFKWIDDQKSRVDIESDADAMCGVYCSQVPFWEMSQQPLVGPRVTLP
jgi:hypothetical protein